MALGPLACASESVFAPVKNARQGVVRDQGDYEAELRDAIAGVLDNTTLAEACRMTNEEEPLATTF